jgi:hypothetical protein
MASLSLSLSSEKLAVCRFPPDTTPPSWVFDGDGFYSITRTREELSVIVPQCIVPAGVKTELDWLSLKVEGPLDFSSTGILSSLASPLADAAISIFAVSTYDTDYILIKEAQMDKAVDVLQSKGHRITSKQRPQDGPAIAFEVDPMIAPLVETDRHHEPTFALILVAGWPPSKALKDSYDTFKDSVRACFDATDVDGDRPAVYLYHSGSLHVTVATVRSLQQSAKPEHRQFICDCAREISVSAQRLWPTQKLELSIQRAQIGKRAGIILWEETTGGLTSMRECFQQAAREYGKTQSGRLSEEEKAILCAVIDEMAVPSIVHSTFLRFYGNPKTPGETIQNRFSSSVEPRLKEFFPSSFPISSVKLVWQNIPYMNIPCDDEHVLFESTLS